MEGEEAIALPPLCSDGIAGDRCAEDDGAGDSILHIAWEPLLWFVV